MRRVGGSLEHEAKTLVERLGGLWSRNGGMCRCPAHDDRTPSLSVRAGRSRLLLHCFAGCEAAAVLRALISADLLDPGAAEQAEAAPDPRPDEQSRAALRLWGSAGPIADSPAASYLASRALHTPSPELRYHPRTPHGPKPFTRFRPAMIAAVRDETGMIAVHRTFLDPGGNSLAPLTNPRCALGRLGKGAVRLGGVASRLGLAEGIETAISATILFGLPCWATLGTERFRNVALPGQVEELLLFVDNDAGGRRAEALARASFQHLTRIETLCPRRPGYDWNDVLRGSVSAAAAR